MVTTVMRDLSLSWWLSQPEQAFLDRQLCLPATSDAIEQALRMSTSGN